MKKISANKKILFYLVSLLMVIGIKMNLKDKEYVTDNVNLKNSSIDKGILNKNQSYEIDLMFELLQKIINDNLSIEEIEIVLKKVNLDPIIQNIGQAEGNSTLIIKSLEESEFIRNVYAEIIEREGNIISINRFSFELNPIGSGYEKISGYFDSFFNLNGLQVMSRPGYKLYELGEKILWIREIDEEFIIEPKPINSYSKNDLGIIEIVFENEIH